MGDYGRELPVDDFFLILEDKTSFFSLLLLFTDLQQLILGYQLGRMKRNS